VVGNNRPDLGCMIIHGNGKLVRFIHGVPAHWYRHDIAFVLESSILYRAL
jgi:hypothetical protein